ncbi:MAG: replicative DNA helicase [Oscillospiraceae bacterium]|nr:replicative DNA helicase [Oscillospiraceae bacterium]MBR5261991.1 replicative DNA helicase [Oscillospiraceae bacterium]
MDELLGRRVPHSPQAEQAVIGSMLIDPACIPDVLKRARADYFYIQTNKEIFETILSMFNYGQTIDPVTVIEQMKSRGVFHEETTKNYIIELMRVTPTAANVGEYIGIISDKALQRELGRAASSITEMVNDGVGDADAMLESAERQIYALRKDRSVGGLKPVSEVMAEVYDNLSEMAANGGQLPGVTTGLIDLDEKILGMNEGELILVASRPGMGKTSIALNIAMAATKATGKTVAIFNLEMSREQLVTRILSSESLVDSQKLLKGNLSSGEWGRIVSAAANISSLNILIDDNPTLSVADMNAQCRRVKNLGLVVIDYLQLMQSAGGKQTSGENRQQIVSDISRMLKIMAKELRVPVLCLSQLSRATEGRTDKRPVLSDLRESGAIEQDADVVIGLYREGYYNRECENPNAAEAVILKNRKGEVGIVPLMWLPDYTSYVNVDRRHGDEY